MSSAASDLWDTFQGAADAPINMTLALVEPALLLASAIGLWHLRKWGVVALLAAELSWLLTRVPLALVLTPTYRGYLPFWCSTTFFATIHVAIFIGLLRLWRRGQLT